MPNIAPIILASSSPYRQQLLSRLGLPFSWLSPELDETPLPGESPSNLVLRLSAAKARKISQQHPSAVVIGSDQALENRGEILGKPGNFDRACEQLTQLSGQTVTFLTGLSVQWLAQNISYTDLVTTTVTYRLLGLEQIHRYLEREAPYDAAGSFKSEALGIALCQRMRSDDPTALVGLPLIRLTDRLLEMGFELFMPKE